MTLTMSLVEHAFQSRLHERHADRRAELVAMLYRAADAEEHLPRFAAGHPCRRIADRLCSCGQHPAIYHRAETGEILLHPGRCNSRLCPLCGRIRANQLRQVVSGHIALLDSPRLITLTLASSDAPLSEQLTRLRDVFRRLRRRPEWRKHVTGGLAVLEVTYQPRTDHWHPHLHILADGQYWKQKDLSALWLEITTDSQIVDIRAVHSKDAACRYISKYVTKTSAPPEAPDRRVTEWAVAIGGLRLAQTFGTLHGQATTIKPEKSPHAAVQVIPVAPLSEAVAQGDGRAKRLYRLLHLVTGRRVPDSAPKPPLLLISRGLRIARRLRSWWECWQEFSREQATLRPVVTTAMYHAYHRAVRLRQEPNNPPPAPTLFAAA